jgi:S-formylglutathione hydrolase FrmB
LLALAGAFIVSSSAHAQVFADGSGLHVISERQLDPRLLELSVHSDALAAATNVRVLLPSGYGTDPTRRYPVLYLLHGTSGRASDWTTLGGAEQATAALPLIVVMPDIALNGNGGGWCTDWYNLGAYGPPRWEMFHIDELVPWIDADLRTIRSRGGRAIAGLSQGGFCSTSYAARHPDLFSTALSFSGAPDAAYDTEAQLLVTPVVNATEAFLDQVAPGSMFGPRATEEINWAGHDPTTLAENLRGLNLLLYTGNGSPGPLDSSPNLGASGIEWGAHELTRLFHDRLSALGIPSFYEDYGPGTHTWPYWARDLREALPMLMADYAHPPSAPSAVTYTSAEPSYEIYGWTVTVHRQVAEFSTLRDADASGFTTLGSGTASVVTARLFQPGRRYRVVIDAGGAVSQFASTATGSGRLVIDVPLGPSNTVQEYPLDGPPLGTRVYSTRVEIRPLARPRRRARA